MANQIKQIVIKVASSGDKAIKNIANSLQKMENQLYKSAKASTQLKNSFQSLAGISIAGFGVRELVRTSDSLQLLTDKMSIFAKEGETGLDVMNGITAAANRQGQSIDDLATIFNRIQVSTLDMRLSTEEALAVTETLTKSFRLAGSSGQELRGTVIQLSQGLAAGALQGQELRSVMEGNALIAAALRERFKDVIKDGENIFKFAERRGGFTAIEVIETLAENTGKWDEMLGKVNFTIGQSLNITLNVLAQKWNDLNTNMGISAKLSKIIIAAGQDMSTTFAVLAGVLAGIFNASILKGLASTIGFFATLNGQIGGLLVASKALAIAMAKFVAIGLAVAGVVKLITDWEGSMLFLEKTWIRIKIVFFDTLEYVANKIQSVSNLIRNSGLSTIADLFTSSGTASMARSKSEGLNGQLNALTSNMEKLNEESNKATFANLLKRLREEGGSTAPTLKLLNNQLDEGTIKIAEYEKQLRKIKVSEIKGAFSAGQIDRSTRDKRLRELDTGKIRDIDVAMASLNVRYLEGEINARGYFDALDATNLKRIEDRMKAGRSNLEEYNRELEQSKIHELNKDFSQLNQSLLVYRDRVAEIKEQNLTAQFEAGRISLQEYDRQLVNISEKFNAGSAFRTGVRDYMDSIGNLSQNISKGIQNVFSNLENGLIEFRKNGKFEFKKFADAILDDLNRIIIRSMILRPLADVILTKAGVPTTTVEKNAKGGVFENGVKKFAKGGVVSSPTYFGMQGSKTGLMGEAGPEAIMPLQRNSKGELGVSAQQPNVIVNVVNNAPESQVEQRESQGPNGERIIDIMIMGKVKEAIVSGKLDKEMSLSYGLSRRGR